MDEFLYRNKILISIVLVLTIIAGGALIWWDKSKGSKIINENQEIAELKTQNELLRQQLSQESSKAVAGAQDVAQTGDKIDINTASAEELDILPGIGPARAADIIAYREANGGFRTTEEIVNIKGIGEKSFEDLKDLITVGQ